MLEVSQLSHQYGSKEALQGVTFTVRPGEITGYLGPNGAGKSTTLKIITGLLRPTQGTVKVAGFDIVTSPLEAKRRLGYVPEHAALYTSLTPNEFLSLMAELYHVEPGLARERIGRLLELFELSKSADQQIESLSKGMRQKVLLSSALLHDPEVLLLDEPLNGLDANAALNLRTILQEMAGRGRTILFCSHILDVVERLCARVIVLNEGRVVADDATAKLLAGSKQGTLESVFRALTRAGANGVTEEWAKAFFGDVPAAPAAGAAAGNGKKRK